MRAASDFWELWYKPHFITTIGPLKIVDRRFSCDQNSEGISNLRAIRGRGDRLVKNRQRTLPTNSNAHGSNQNKKIDTSIVPTQRRKDS